jgi:site-specific DNA-adenine methylase
MNDEIREIAKEKYFNFRKFYNQSEKNYLDLFTLTFFSFCNLIRFNSKNQFNMPFGNRTYSKKQYYLNFQQAHYQINKQPFDILNNDVFELLKFIDFKEHDFIYLDPPYLNTEAIYNEKRAFGGWNIEHDLKLFEILDNLNSRGIRWCLSNVKENKGKVNQHLIDWANKNNYRIIGMNKNYSALGKGNANTYEICVINYHYEGDGFKIIQESLF